MDGTSALHTQVAVAQVIRQDDHDVRTGCCLVDDGHEPVDRGAVHVFDDLGGTHSSVAFVSGDDGGTQSADNLRVLGNEDFLSDSVL